MKSKKISSFISILKISLPVIIGGISMYLLLEIKSPQSIFELIKILFLSTLGYYTAILLHEIGHIIGFKFYGYKILLIAVGPIIYINSSYKKIKFKFSNFIFAGGIIPKAGEIDSDDKSEKFTKAFEVSLLLGPVVNIITAFICTICMITMKHISIYLYFVMLTSIITFVYSIIRTVEIEGDLYSYFQSRKNVDFVAMYLYKYSVLSDCCNEYLDNLMKDILKCILEKKNLEIDEINLLGEFIDYYSVNSYKLPEFIDKFVDYWMENYNLIEYKAAFHQQMMVTVFHKYLYNKLRINDEVEHYKKFYNDYMYGSNVLSNSPLQFFKDRSECMLKINSSENYLNKTKNFNNIMVLEYLLEKYDYINKLKKI